MWLFVIKKPLAWLIRRLVLESIGTGHGPDHLIVLNHPWFGKNQH